MQPNILYERDVFDNIIVKKSLVDAEKYETQYFEYDNKGRITRSLKKDAEETIFEDIKYINNYNKDGLIVSKGSYYENMSGVESETDGLITDNIHFVYDYKFNSHNMPIEKKCLLKHSNELVYITNYQYKENKISKIEKYDNLENLTYVETFCIEGKDVKIKTVKLDNGIVSFKKQYSFASGNVISMRNLNPMGGTERWKVLHYGNNYIGIDVIEEVLTVEMLNDILAYSDSFRSEKSFSVNICEYNTDRFLCFEDYSILSDFEKKYKTSISFFV